MEWFYAQADEQKGPVTEQEFQQLAAQGVITAQTLVWREGFPAWQPYGTTSVSPDDAPPLVNAVQCAECGGQFPTSEVIPLSGRMYCASCKPIIVQRLKEGLSGSTGADETRRHYLKHEASVRSIGILYYLGGAAFTVLGGAAVVRGITHGLELRIIVAVFLLGVGIAQLFLAHGLRGLKPWARIPTAIFSGIGLLGFPVGTIVNAYIMYLVLGEKGKMVFSPEYQDVIAQTPHIKYRTSILIWILLGLIVLAIGAALILPMLARLKARG